MPKPPPTSKRAAETQRPLLFLSFSRNLSGTCARIFTEWLEKIFGTERFETFMSEDTLRKGRKWHEDMHTALQRSSFGIFFLTLENHDTSKWMIYEAGALAGKVGKTYVCPLLLNVPEKELHSIYTHFEITNFEEQDIWSLVKTINENLTCPLELLPLEALFKQHWPQLEKSWRDVIDDHASQIKPQAGFTFTEAEFDEWANHYHNIIHKARDICVSMLAAHPPTFELPEKKDSEESPPPHPAMERYRQDIQHILAEIRTVFNSLVSPCDASVWVCLRDRRSDGCYHTFARSGDYDVKRPEGTKPWEESADCVQSLKATYESAECVHITGEGCPDWKPDHNQRHHEQRSVMMGAIIGKSTNGMAVRSIPARDVNSLIWVLCINSKTPNLFNAGHKRILQACNDALSAIANVMFRASHS